ncbi:MAG: DUF535 family protein [Bacteroidota bacterium]
MKTGVINILGQLYHLAKEVVPDRSPTGFKQRMWMLAGALKRFPQIRKWYRISDNPSLTQARERFPQMHEVIYAPYIHRQWPLSRRLATIDQHYRMLHGSAAIIARATLEEVELANFNEEYAGLRLTLKKSNRFLGEGEVALNLLVGEQRYYSVALTLGMDSGDPLILIGALQGSSAEEAAAVYREMTHALHGMRPRDLLMTSLKLLSRQLGIHRIWAISSTQRHRFSKKLKADYDAMWQEHNGQLLDNGFFEIPAEVRYRQMEEIVSRKRKIYRLRYQMLDRLAEDIATACASTSNNAAPREHRQITEKATAHDGLLATGNRPC